MEQAAFKKSNIPAELIDLFPAYLQRRIDDADKMMELAQQNDFAGVKWIAHKIHGNAKPWGLEQVGNIAKQLEAKCNASAAEEIKGLLAQMKAELSSVQKGLEA